MDSTRLYYSQSNSRIIYSSKSEESWLAGIKMDLAKITDSSIDYFPETFAGPSGTVCLKRLLHEENSLLTQEVFYDSPFTGLGSGLVVGHGVDAIPVDESNDEWAYVATIWVKFESGADDPVGGS